MAMDTITVTFLERRIVWETYSELLRKKIQCTKI